jgi:multiple sugar transport system substrate-binding protein
MFKSRFLLLFMMASLITGCGNQKIIDSTQPDVELDDDRKVQIEIWHTYSEEETRIFENELIPLFELDYPTIDIKPVRQPYNDQLMSAIVSRASSNKPPDIVRMDIVWQSKYADLDLLYPVSNFEDFYKIKERFYDEPLKSNRYEGNYYGLPLNTNTKIAIYNRETLEKLGLSNPPEKMEELINLVEENGLMIGMSDIDTWNSLPYFYGLGGKLTNPEETKATGYLDSDESISAVEKLVELYQKEMLNRNLLGGRPDLWEGIRVGSYFMIDEGPWFYSINTKEEIEKIRKETVAAPFPTHNGIGSVLGGENLVITRGSKHVEESWTFLKWMTTETPQQMLLQTGQLPTNKNVKMSGVFEQYPYYLNYLNSLDQTFLRPTVSEWRRIEEIYASYLRMIFSETISVREGLSKAATEIDRMLQAKKDKNT